MNYQYETEYDENALDDEPSTEGPMACLLDVQGLASDARWQVVGTGEDAYDDEYDDSYGMEFVKLGLNDSTQDQLRCSVDLADDEVEQQDPTTVREPVATAKAQPPPKSQPKQPQQREQRDQREQQSRAQQPKAQQPAAAVAAPAAQQAPSHHSGNNNNNKSKKSKSHNRRDNALKKRTIV